MYYATTRKNEGLKALLSVAALAVGLLLSSMAASTSFYLGADSADVVGVWRWVEPAADGADVASPLFEIRRAPDGLLEAMIVIRSGDHSSEADVS